MPALSILSLLQSTPGILQTALASSAAELAIATPPSKNVIIQMFEWNWDSIATECTEFIGPAGYAYVQVSPPQEHVQGPQWWTDYQPVSYTLTSKRGNQVQLENMINKCHSAGVKVITDTLFNHMSGMENGTGVAGSPFTHYNYPGLYNYDDFHHCGLTPGDEILNYTNRAEVQTCELLNLADLATEKEHVRATLAKYGNHLISLGVNGFRLDAAKHIAASDLADILSRLTKPVYISQETIWGAGEPIQPSEYVGNGQVQEFRYTTLVKKAFLGQNTSISALHNLEKLGWVSGSQANVFVANHDTERNGDSLNYKSPYNTYLNAMIFSLAHPYGTPTILSSYSFDTTDDGGPNNGHGACPSPSSSVMKPDPAWLCQHRHAAVAGMVGFHNEVGDAPITDWVSPQEQQIAFGRGSSGFVAINNADTPWKATFTTSLPDNKYCNVITDKHFGGGCSTGVFTVNGGRVIAIVPPRGAIAMHTGKVKEM
ncbi:putative glycoside hydrolase family 13 protein [Favolaschia claudopus]|uniref:Alpha-amylase n=1 Tax=Favolaschia claudopus TaxID=2862362 RepID=A0AAV9ZFK6_9AGAR